MYCSYNVKLQGWIKSCDAAYLLVGTYYILYKHRVLILTVFYKYLSYSKKKDSLIANAAPKPPPVLSQPIPFRFQMPPSVVSPPPARLEIFSMCSYMNSILLEPLPIPAIPEVEYINVERSWLGTKRHCRSSILPQAAVAPQPVPSSSQMDMAAVGTGSKNSSNTY